MSEASLLCLQNDLLCCVKEGKKLFRCHENKGLDNIRRLEQRPTLSTKFPHISGKEWRAKSSLSTTQMMNKRWRELLQR